MTAHPSHQWPEQIAIGTRCPRCGCLRGGFGAGIICVPVAFGVVRFEDVRPCDVEAPE